MKLKFNMKTLAVALMIAMAPLANTAYSAPATPAIVQTSFAAPDDAAKALAEAVRAEDLAALLAVVGPTSRTWLSSGDAVADKEGWRKFLAAYDLKHSISPSTDGRAFLLVGDGDWPFPAPLVRKGNSWVFDAAAGREEIINRRVGQNELSAIQTLQATVDAQREYATADLDSNGFNDYARHFISSEGKKDGLFWPVSANEPPSPFGPLVAEAKRMGYGKKQAPYHGYFFRMLTEQGKSAPGGAYSYMANGKMIGGFAAVAYPAKYGSSGVMTFIVSHDGTVYEKNLGKTTESKALKIRSFSPDSSWKKSQ
ncbi:MAG: DUF2950 domain-containing protein [Azonexus sp.]|nr:DUF2950 domain-containing protein [Azonexus sp.]